MQKMGFHSTWISGIMSCVKWVSFILLLNGKRVGSFCPTRGIRQGTPFPLIFFF